MDGTRVFCRSVSSAVVFEPNICAEAWFDFNSFPDLFILYVSSLYPTWRYVN